MAELKIEEKSLDELQEYENNPRKNKKAIDAVKKSIQKFGFVNPVIITEAGVILAGHTRLKAAKAAGLETVPVIVLHHLTEQEARAFRIADNRASDFTTWDDAALKTEMESLDVDDWEDFGFSKKFLEDITVGTKCTCPKCGKTFEEF